MFQFIFQFFLDNKHVQWKIADARTGRAYIAKKMRIPFKELLTAEAKGGGKRENITPKFTKQPKISSVKCA